MLSRLRYLDNNLWLWATVNAAARWDLARARRKLRDDPEMFQDLRCYCAFVGYQRSGHSVVGSILDAHPNAVVSHRLDALKHAGRGCAPDEVFYMIWRNSRRFARSGRHLTAYSYALPGQGTAAKLTVIGDQEGQHTSRRLRERPDLLRDFLASRRVRLRFIHVIRDPLDNIATIANRTQLPLRRVIDDYFELCQGVLAVKSTYGEDAVLDIYHEDVIDDPAGQIVRFCEFLHLPADEAWVRRCAEVVYKTPNRSRATRAWKESDLRAVRLGMAGVDHLARYRSEELQTA